ncbi:MAG: M23 family metallopeptidase [Anaerovorax sp.]|nr:M23 family metallopeptidase [Anaerovorax sp.]
MCIIFSSLPVDVPLRITSRFGSRSTALKGASSYHRGVDIGRDFSKKETCILAVADGSVIENCWNDVRGWVIIINHGNFKTLYQHLKEQSNFYIGLNLKAGQKIGTMGASTKTIINMKIHLHFELIVGNVPIDPEPYLRCIRKIGEEKGENTMKRYNKVEELPMVLRGEIKLLVDCGALVGNSQGDLELTEDMARVLVVNTRYINKLFGNFKKWNQL